MGTISKSLKRAIESVKSWPTDRQNAAAEMIERMNMLVTTPYELSADECADLEEALTEARRGEFATDKEVAAMFARHGL